MRRAASLFCGAGGTCLGLRQAGFDVVAGFDMNADALATYAAAGGHPVQHMITVDEPVPADLVDALSGLDLLWASPPCQPWSQAGKRLGSADDRDAWPATIAAVRLLRPCWFIAENVRGVEDHYRSFVVPALEAMGYRVSWRVLDAADYGLPQRRHRVILVAGPEPFAWPHPTHGKRSLFVRQGWKSMGEALGIVSGAVDSRMSRPQVDGTRTPALFGLDKPAPPCRSRPAEFIEDPRHPPCNPDKPATTIRSGGSGHSAPPVYMVAAGETGEGRPRSIDQPAPTQNTKKTTYWLNQPSPAVCAGDGGKGSGQWSANQSTREAIVAATGRRRLTPEECAILQGFPPDYPWQGGITSRYRQIGNAVPPLLARVLAERLP